MLKIKNDENKVTYSFEGMSISVDKEYIKHLEPEALEDLKRTLVRVKNKYYNEQPK